uniref:Uncharacterized protein n=1 Tax=Rhizophora mucronata TaxID=61149 RepID=A0A2P2N3C1_RHIMU
MLGKFFSADGLNFQAQLMPIDFLESRTREVGESRFKTLTEI